jgi:protein involved in polysaccharide export with SLBB domain
MHSYSALAGLLIAFAILSSGCANSRRPASTTLPTQFTPTPVAGLPPVDPAMLQRPEAEHRLGPGDVLDIEILGDAASRTRTVVGPDGKIYFYVLPGIDVWGMTINEARAKVVREMQNFIREEQPISMTLRTAASQRIWVLGRLTRPGIYTMTGPTTLLEAIAQAGGLSPMSGVMTTAGTMGFASSRGASDEAADLSRAFVIRQGKLLRVDFERLLRNGDMAQNIYLQPDDFVYLPSANTGAIHVLGAVTNPRTLDYTGGQTLAQVVAEAGGLLRESFPSEVAVVRGSLSEPKVAVVDLKAILAGQTSDVVLEPQDIVYVPHSPYRVLTRYVNIILDTFVRTVGVNEGARAVSGSASPVGVNVPLGGL